jgi:hypothetical protein
LDFDEIAAYFVGCAAFPSIATDASGNMYITYSAIMENFSTGAQNYRHQFVVHSMDGGVTWNTEDACDLTPDIDFDGYEAVFGSIAPDVVNGKLEIIYQRDFEPGLHVRGDLDPIDINDIVHIKVPIDLLDDFSICNEGCMDPQACNYDPNANNEDDSCAYNNCGCTEAQACNYDPTAEFDDGSCCECAEGTFPPLLLGTWEFDTSVGAISVGPSPLSDDWYSSPEDGLQPTQLDDRWTFTTSNLLIYENSGTTLNPFEGFIEVEVDWEPWTFAFDSVGSVLGFAEFTLFSEDPAFCGWMGVWDSGPSYEIVELTETNLVIHGIVNGPDCSPQTGYFTLRFVRSEPFEGNVCIEDCMDEFACNFNPLATIENNLECTYPGCFDPESSNYNPDAGCSGECVYLSYDCVSIGDEAWADEAMGLFPEWQQAMYGVAWEGEWVFNVAATIVEPVSGITYGVHHVDWNSVIGMPGWASADYTLGDLDASSQYCIAASGIPTTPGMYEVTASGEVFISIFGQPFSIGEQSYSAWLEVMDNPNPIPGCMYGNAVNFLSYATDDDGSCLFGGCTDANAANFNPIATVDDGSCGEECEPGVDSSCSTDANNDGTVSVADLLILLGEFGGICE